MRCKEAAQHLQLYVDGRLSMKQTRALEAHVSSCAACRADVALLEQVAGTLHTFRLVAEPEDLTANIMRRVSMSTPRSTAPKFSLLRPSPVEILTAVLLATVATLVSLMQQPAVRAVLPIANGHDSLSLAFIRTLHLLTTVDIGTLILALWVIGTILGICITLVLAGEEVRSRWFRAMMERLPVR